MAELETISRKPSVLLPEAVPRQLEGSERQAFDGAAKHQREAMAVVGVRKMMRMNCIASVAGFLPMSVTTQTARVTLLVANGVCDGRVTTQ